MKGNMLLGHARGSVGDVTFTRYKGQQTAHARNRQPANPRTVAQMMQRSLFICASKFFHRGEQNFFKFAFENKNEKWSDFNAFMAVNANRGVHLTKAQAECPSYPALGKWTMTQGSLPSAILRASEEAGGFALTYAEQSSAPTTVGQFSKALIDKYQGLKNGDIATFVAISVPAGYDYPVLSPDNREVVQWKIVQFKLDSTSTQTLSNLFTEFPFSPDFGLETVGFGTLSIPCCMCVTFSRTQRGKGLKVSTSDLVLNEESLEALYAHQTDEYIQDVMDAWGAQDPSILEGSLVQ